MLRERDLYLLGRRETAHGHIALDAIARRLQTKRAKPAKAEGGDRS
jgi:hypothetical protein